MNAQTRAAQGSHNTARLFPNPKISLNAREIRRLRGLVPPPPPPIPADWAPIDAHLPWGGMKSSGIGREGGLSGVLAYTEEKVVTVVTG